MPVKTFSTGYVVFHCRYCATEIISDGSVHRFHFADFKAAWQDKNGIYYCLNLDGDYIMPHRPLTKEIRDSIDAALEGIPMEAQAWADELPETERKWFEKVKDTPLVELYRSFLA